MPLAACAELMTRARKVDATEVLTPLQWACLPCADSLLTSQAPAREHQKQHLVLADRGRRPQQMHGYA